MFLIGGDAQESDPKLCFPMLGFRSPTFDQPFSTCQLKPLPLNREYHKMRCYLILFSNNILIAVPFAFEYPFPGQGSQKPFIRFSTPY